MCRRNNNNYGSHLLVPLSISFSILYNIPKFFELVPCDGTETNAQNTTTEISYNFTTYTELNEELTQKITNESIFCDPNGIRATPMRQNFWYIIFYTVLSKLLLVEIIPWITVMVLNYCIWRRLKEFHSAREITLGSQISLHQGNY